MVDPQVKLLQIFLNSLPETRVALSGPGSASHETTRFGLLTKAAVIKFQEKFATEILHPTNLVHGTGFVGPKTLEKLNSLLKNR